MNLLKCSFRSHRYSLDVALDKAKITKAALKDPAKKSEATKEVKAKFQKRYVHPYPFDHVDGWCLLPPRLLVSNLVCRYQEGGHKWFFSKLRF